MAEENKKIVLQIELSADQAASKLVELKEKTAKVKEEQAAYRKELEGLKAGSVQYDNIQKAIVRTEAEVKSLNAEQRIYQRIIVGNISSQNQQQGSLEQLKASLSSLTAQYNLLSAEEKANGAIGGQLQGQIRGISDELKKQESALGNNTRNVGNYQSALDGVDGKLRNIAATIGIGFGASEAISLLKDTVKSFQEAELNARKLQAALGPQGGLQQDFQELVLLSNQLESGSIFSDDQIQQAEAVALNFGLTRDQIASLLPMVIDFASITGQDLNSALENVLKGIEGSAKGLKLYGIQVDENGTLSENFGTILDQLTNKFQGQAAVVSETSTGALEQYKNQLDNIQEGIGEKVAPALQNLRGLSLDLTESLVSAASDLGAVFDKLFGTVDKKGTDLVAAARKQNEDLKNSYVETFNKLDTSTLESKLETVTDLFNESNTKLQTASGIEAGLLRQQVINYGAQRQAITQILAAGSNEAINIRTATNEQLEKLGTIDARDELKRRKDQAEALSKISQKDADNVKKALDGLKDLYEKNHVSILEQVSKTIEEKRAIERQADIDEVNAAFEKTDKLKEAQTLRDNALADIDTKYRQLSAEDSKKQFDDALKQAEATAAEMDRIAKENAAKEKSDRLEYEEFISTQDQGQLQQQLEQLTKQKDAILQNATLTADQRLIIEETFAQKKAALEELILESQFNATSNNLKKLSGVFSKHTAAYKLLASASVVMDTYTSAQAAYRGTLQTIPAPYGLVPAAAAAAVAVIAGLANLAKINGVSIPGGSFYEGGYTGSGNPRDESSALGQKHYTYHKDEYVVPSKVLNNPAAAPLVNQLESFRRNLYNDSGPGARMIMGRAYAETGGLVPGFNPLEGRVVTSISSISPEALELAVSNALTNMKTPVVAVRDINSEQASVKVGDDRAIW